LGRRHLRPRGRQHVPSFEVRRAVEPVIAPGLGCYSLDLLTGPDVKGPLLAFGVGVLGGMEGAALVAQVVEHVIEGLGGDAAVERVGVSLEGVGVGPGELGVVVEHLLEVGHGPCLVHGVAGKAPSELVVDSPQSHLVEGELQGVGHPRHPSRHPQQELEHWGLRKLRCSSKASVLSVVGGEDLGGSLEKEAVGKRLARGGRRSSLDGLEHPLPLGEELGASGRPEVGDLLHDPGKPRHAPTVVRREVGAGEEGDAFWGGEDRHGPASTAGEGLGGGHVDRVDVRTLLPVDLDADEAFVHLAGDPGVLEALPLHHMAPVAGGVADGDEQGLVLGAGPGQGLLPPRVPVHGIVLVLEKVGGGLGSQAVGHGPTLCQYPPLWFGVRAPSRRDQPCRARLDVQGSRSVSSRANPSRVCTTA
jgi:hypothetical protein